MTPFEKALSAVCLSVTLTLPIYVVLIWIVAAEGC